MNDYFTGSDLLRIEKIALKHNIPYVAFVQHCEKKQRDGTNVTGGYDPAATIERQVNSFLKNISR